MVGPQLPKLRAVGSIPITRSIIEGGPYRSHDLYLIPEISDIKMARFVGQAFYSQAAYFFRSGLI